MPTAVPKTWRRRAAFSTDRAPQAALVAELCVHALAEVTEESAEAALEDTAIVLPLALELCIFACNRRGHYRNFLLITQ